MLSININNSIINCPLSEGRDWIYYIYIPNVEKYIIDSVNNKDDVNDTL